jgi:hypothetical protein
MDIERIRQMAKEQGLVCLPREIKKYTGSFSRRQKKGGRATYRALIKHKDLYLSKTFKTEVEAEQYIHLTNVRGFTNQKQFYCVC